MSETCPAKIIINGFTYLCDRERAHLGAHEYNKIVYASEYYGFEWDIDDNGVVIINMDAPAVMVIGAMNRDESSAE